MDNAVIKYRQRRQKRLDAKAVERYKMRRDERLLSRFDDDDDAENGSGGKHGGGHGNTKIPFGLCQREGIKVQPNWTPKDAWDALAEKGYSAGEVYAELKKSGKIGVKKSKAEKPKSFQEQIEKIRDNAQKSGRSKSYTSEEIYTAGKAAMEQLSKLMDKTKKVQEARTKLDNEIFEIMSAPDFDFPYDAFFPSKELKEKMDKLDEIDEQLKKMTESMPGKRERVQNVISSVRSVGMGKCQLEEIAVRGRECDKSKMYDFETAMNLYPTDWVDSMVKNVEKYGKFSVSSAKRGYFSGFDRVIGLSDREGCAIHEIGHFIEKAVPEIREAEKEFYEHRTKGEKLVPYISGSSEMIREDHFIHPYMGKDYGGSAYELVSMGFEYIFDDYEWFHEKDPEMCEWVLGLLTLY